MKYKENYFYETDETFSTIREVIDKAYEKYSDLIFCKYRDGKEIKSRTYSEMYSGVLKMSEYLKNNMKIKRFALVGKTSFEWLISYYSGLYTGIPVVLIDKLLPSEVIAEQVEFSDADCIIFGSGFEKTAEDILSRSEKRKTAIPFSSTNESVMSVKEICSGDKASDKRNIFGEIDTKSLAEICFTSGTTGNYKAVMLSHENIASTVLFSTSVLRVSQGDNILSIMPNHHTYELTEGIICPLCFGVTISINDNLRRLMADFAEFKPNVVIVVPALLKILRKEIVKKAKKQGKYKSLNRALKINALAHMLHLDFGNLFFSELLKIFGGNLDLIVCGGAFLDNSLIDFVQGLGLQIIQGYGITECSPLISVNSTKERKTIGLGKASPYCKVKIIEDEICVSGKNVMMGYYKNSELTQDVIKDGFFHTGDLGYIDHNGYLYMTGRKKNLIILNNGENVSPEEVENRLDDIDIIESVVVYGEDDVIVAEVFPNEKHIKENEVTDIYNEVKCRVFEKNSGVPLYKQIQKVVIRTNDFEKTTTHKIKRSVVIDKNEK